MKQASAKTACLSGNSTDGLLRVRKQLSTMHDLVLVLLSSCDLGAIAARRAWLTMLLVYMCLRAPTVRKGKPKTRATVQGDQVCGIWSLHRVCEKCSFNGCTIHCSPHWGPSPLMAQVTRNGGCMWVRRMHMY